MNKYQEALDVYKYLYKEINETLYEKTGNYFHHIDKDRCEYILQELIDKYSKDSFEHHCSIVDGIREQWRATERLAEKMAKALDKACELLTCLDCHDCERVCHIKCDDVRKSDLSCAKEDWKEWLLKNEN